MKNSTVPARLSDTWECINYLNKFLADSFDIGFTFGDQRFLFAKFLFKLIPSINEVIIGCISPFEIFCQVKFSLLKNIKSSL